ncbi:hypothetical protein CEXT_157271 [Caerostris extrusa]|uniref:Uncharacterized protein n=1 Tax=Caerostris extrusa TaxID=172846 RepID=A0AAV4NGC8_CAEEX|nr:hypothetical protein CEXT_157271 [Caerostris extrusa]
MSESAPNRKDKDRRPHKFLLPTLPSDDLLSGSEIALRWSNYGNGNGEGRHQRLNPKNQFSGNYIPWLDVRSSLT